MRMDGFERKIDVKSVEISPVKESIYPSIKVVFLIENKSTCKIIGFPAICKFKWEGFEIGESIAFESLGGLSTSVSVSGSGYLQSSIISQNRTIGYSSVFQFRPEVFGFIVKTLEGRYPGSRDITLDIEICFPFITQDSSSPPREPPYSLNLWLTHHHKIDESEWYGWIKSWGVNIDWIYLPTDMAGKLRELREKLGLASEWEVISEMLKQSAGLKPSPMLFLENAKEKIEELIDTATKQIFIMCEVIDTTISQRIIDSFKRGVDVKVLLPPLEKLRARKSVKKAIDDLKRGGIEIRENSYVHARFLIADDKTIVGSTDLDLHGLTVHLNASIFTANPTVINGLKMFFNEVWDKSGA